MAFTVYLNIYKYILTRWFLKQSNGKDGLFSVFQHVTKRYKKLDITWISCDDSLHVWL